MYTDLVILRAHYTVRRGRGIRDTHSVSSLPHWDLAGQDVEVLPWLSVVPELGREKERGRYMKNRMDDYDDIWLQTAVCSDLPVQSCPDWTWLGCTRFQDASLDHGS